MKAKRISAVILFSLLFSVAFAAQTPADNSSVSSKKAPTNQELQQEIEALYANAENPVVSHQGVAGFLNNRLIFSGGIMTQIIASNRDGITSFTGDGTRKMDMNDTWLTTHAILTKNLSALATIHEAPNQVNTSGGTGGVEFEEAYLAYSQLMHDSRVTFDIGKQYLPFGVYEHHPVVNTLTQTLDETIREAAVVGFARKYFYASGYVFSGDGSLQGYDGNNNRRSEPRELSNGGVELGAVYTGKTFSWNLDIDWISNMAESMQIFAIMPVTNHRVGNLATHASFTLHKLSLIYDGSYATQHFKRSDVTFDGKSARPVANAVELAYQIPVFNHPGTFAIGYSNSDEGLFLGLPEGRSSVSYTYYLNHYVTLIFEGLRSTNYSGSHTATFLNSGGATTTVNGNGKVNITGITNISVHF